MPLRGKHILVGVTGGIAAYKVGYFVRELVRAGAEARVVMTEAAARFVTPLTFSALSKNPVAMDLWASDQATGTDLSTRHIDLANWADVMVIAPASANTIAKITHGVSDNLLTIVTLACTRPVVLAPTMDADMYLNNVTQRNLATLRERGFHVIQPGEGDLASGLKGPGRLPEVDELLRFVERILDGLHRDLARIRVLVTAGPTFEAIDPVRFIGNRSSGKMGFAIAQAAAQRGAAVTLIAGPTHLETPRYVRRIDVESADQMHRAVLAEARKAKAVIMAAAVADYMPVRSSAQKIKKQGSGMPEMKLKRTPDILAALGRQKKRNRILVGFALETEHELENARAKLKQKNLDLIVLNSLAAHPRVFGADTNLVKIIDRRGTVGELPEMPKFDVANRILDRVREMLYHR